MLVALLRRLAAAPTLAPAPPPARAPAWGRPAASGYGVEGANVEAEDKAQLSDMHVARLREKRQVI